MCVDPVQWSVEECCAWLESIDLGELRESFNENSIFGSVLLELSEEDMKSMGILKLGHRKKLLKKIAALRADTGINIAGSSSLTGPNPMSGTTASTLATSSSSNMDDSNRTFPLSDSNAQRNLFRRDFFHNISVLKRVFFEIQFEFPFLALFWKTHKCVLPLQFSAAVA